VTALAARGLQGFPPVSQPLPFDPIAQARRQWHDRWGEEPARPMAAVTSVMRAQQILLARLGELLRPLGLTFPRYEALMQLVFSRTGSLPVGKMGERLQVHRTSMTHMADRLEEAGLVTRVSHARDRRSTLIAITPAGRDLAERATRILNEAAFAMQPLDDDDLDALTDVLSAIRRHEGDFTTDVDQKTGVSV
jgi:DNA-binding MarR family transcriptional regulator